VTRGKTLLTFALCLGFAAPAAAERRPSLTVKFNTADGCALEAFYHAPSSGAYVFLNAHGLGSGKNEWAVFEAELKKRGYGWLSFDFRGHGKSSECGGQPVDYRSFAAARWGFLSGDILASAAFLKTKEISEKKLVLCGASIGANLSLKAVTEGLRPAAVILLSPGIVYAGVRSEDFFKKDLGVPVFISAAPNDEYSWRSSNYLAAQAGKNGIKGIFSPGACGHGVNMFTPEGCSGAASKAMGSQTAAQTSLLNAILDWVEKLKDAK
jgi:pimeloyl-ACP methyl ester carboxylesterase